MQVSQFEFLKFMKFTLYYTFVSDLICESNEYPVYFRTFYIGRREYYRYLLDTILRENLIFLSTVEPVLSGLSKRQKIGFQYRLLLNAGQKYCRMLPLEHSAILLTFIKLPFVIEYFILSIFEWPLKTGSTVITVL